VRVIRSVKWNNNNALGQVHKLVFLERGTTLLQVYIYLLQLPVLLPPTSVILQAVSKQPARTGAARLQSDSEQFSLSKFQTELSVALWRQDDGGFVGGGGGGGNLE
jgi:hypothetical protein